MLKIRRPLGRLIFNMGIAIPGKTVFLIETAPWWSEPLWRSCGISVMNWQSLYTHIWCKQLSCRWSEQPWHSCDVNVRNWKLESAHEWVIITYIGLSKSMPSLVFTTNTPAHTLCEPFHDGRYQRRNFELVWLLKCRLDCLMVCWLLVWVSLSGWDGDINYELYAHKY